MIFRNVDSVQLGSTAITTVTSIAVTQRRTRIQFSGDNDAFRTVDRPGACAVEVTVHLGDPDQAMGLDGLAGALSFVWKDAQGQTDKTVTISNCSVIGVSGTVAHDAASQAAVTLAAESSDGVTDPVSIA